MPFTLATLSHPMGILVGDITSSGWICDSVVYCHSVEVVGVVGVIVAGDGSGGERSFYDVTFIDFMMNLCRRYRGRCFH